MASYKEALIVENAGGDGAELLVDLLLEGQLVSAADLGSLTAPTAGEFRVDVISVDPEDGSVTTTEGSETDDQTQASAEAPAIPADEVLLAVVTVQENAAAAEVLEIDLDRIGEDARVSADE